MFSEGKHSLTIGWGIYSSSVRYLWEYSAVVASTSFISTDIFAKIWAVTQGQGCVLGKGTGTLTPGQTNEDTAPGSQRVSPHPHCSVCTG